MAELDGCRSIEYLASIAIPKLHILRVSEGGPSLWRHESTFILFYHTALHIPSLILPAVVEVQCDSHCSASSLRPHDRHLCRAIIWRIASLKSLWAYDVADGKGSTDDCGCERAFRSATKICCSPLKLRWHECGDHDLRPKKILTT
jgi:hypothetical protein